MKFAFINDRERLFETTNWKKLHYFQALLANCHAQFPADIWSHDFLLRQSFHQTSFPHDVGKSAMSRITSPPNSPMKTKYPNHSPMTQSTGYRKTYDPRVKRDVNGIRKFQIDLKYLQPTNEHPYDEMRIKRVKRQIPDSSQVWDFHPSSLFRRRLGNKRREQKNPTSIKVHKSAIKNAKKVKHVTNVDVPVGKGNGLLTDKEAAHEVHEFNPQPADVNIHIPMAHYNAILELNNLQSHKEIIGTSNKLLPPNQIIGTSNNLLPPNQIIGTSNNLLPPNQIIGTSNNLLPPNQIIVTSNKLLPRNQIIGTRNKVLTPNQIIETNYKLLPRNQMIGTSNKLPPRNHDRAVANNLPLLLNKNIRASGMATKTVKGIPPQTGRHKMNRTTTFTDQHERMVINRNNALTNVQQRGDINSNIGDTNLPSQYINTKTHDQTAEQPQFDFANASLLGGETDVLKLANRQSGIMGDTSNVQRHTHIKQVNLVGQSRQRNAAIQQGNAPSQINTRIKMLENLIGQTDNLLLKYNQMGDNIKERMTSVYGKTLPGPPHIHGSSQLTNITWPSAQKSNVKTDKKIRGSQHKTGSIKNGFDSKNQQKLHRNQMVVRNRDFKETIRPYPPKHPQQPMLNHKTMSAQEPLSWQQRTRNKHTKSNQAHMSSARSQQEQQQQQHQDQPTMKDQTVPAQPQGVLQHSNQLSQQNTRTMSALSQDADKHNSHRHMSNSQTVPKSQAMLHHGKHSVISNDHQFGSNIDAVLVGGLSHAIQKNRHSPSLDQRTHVRQLTSSHILPTNAHDLADSAMGEINNYSPNSLTPKIIISFSQKKNKFNLHNIHNTHRPPNITASDDKKKIRSKSSPKQQPKGNHHIEGIRLPFPENGWSSLEHGSHVRHAQPLVQSHNTPKSASMQQVSHDTVLYNNIPNGKFHDKSSEQHQVEQNIRQNPALLRNSQQAMHIKQRRKSGSNLHTQSTRSQGGGPSRSDVQPDYVLPDVIAALDNPLRPIGLWYPSPDAPIGHPVVVTWRKPKRPKRRKSKSTFQKSRNSSSGRKYTPMQPLLSIAPQSVTGGENVKSWLHPRPNIITRDVQGNVAKTKDKNYRKKSIEHNSVNDVSKNVQRGKSSKFSQDRNRHRISLNQNVWSTNHRNLSRNGRRPGYTKRPVDNIIHPAETTMHLVGNARSPVGNTKRPARNNIRQAVNTMHQSRNARRLAGNTKRPAEITERPSENRVHATRNTKLPAENTKHSVRYIKHLARNTNRPVENTKHKYRNTERTAEHTRHTVVNTKRTAENANHPAVNSRPHVEKTINPAVNTNQTVENTNHQPAEKINSHAEHHKHPVWNRKRPTETANLPDHRRNKHAKRRRPFRKHVASHRRRVFSDSGTVAPLTTIRKHHHRGHQRLDSSALDGQSHIPKTIAVSTPTTRQDNNSTTKLSSTSSNLVESSARPKEKQDFSWNAQILDIFNNFNKVNQSNSLDKKRNKTISITKEIRKSQNATTENHHAHAPINVHLYLEMSMPTNKQQPKSSNTADMLRLLQVLKLLQGNMIPPTTIFPPVQIVFQVENETRPGKLRCKCFPKVQGCPSELNEEPLMDMCNVTVTMPCCEDR